MCIFSGGVQAVADTRIFARLSGHGTQFLAYQMNFASDRDLAMILPVPVQIPVSPSSLRFINLQKYPAFFADMERPGYGSPGGGISGGAIPGAASAAPLPVQSVGSFAASFVPTLSDFKRLDKRFVLPPQIWAKIPAYRDFGFAVFKLKRTNGVQAPPHPMAFEFRTRYANRLFLPTIHIHDEQIHATETFDHALYVQDARLTPTDGRDSWGNTHPTRPNDRLDSSGFRAAHFMKIAKTQKIVDAHLPVFKRALTGTHANRDTVFDLA